MYYYILITTNIALHFARVHFTKICSNNSIGIHNTV